MSNNSNGAKKHKETPILDGENICVATNCPPLTAEREFIDNLLSYLGKECRSEGFRISFILIDNDKFGIRKPFTIKF